MGLISETDKKALRILLVEDEKIVAMDIRHSLTMMGYKTIQLADSGEEAIKAVLTTQPDLILMDIQLNGEINGIDAARRINQYADIPLIYITAHSDETTFNKAKNTGPYGYIIKPVEEKELRTGIEVALMKFHMEQQLKESRQWFREIFEQNSDGVILIRRSDFQPLDANAKAESLFQYSRDELLADFPAIFGDESAYHSFREALCGFNQTVHEHFLDRMRIRRRDGGEMIVSVKTNVAMLAGSETLYCSFRDVSEKVRIEEETRELHSRLLQANKMVSLGTLASGIAHEINNPNNFILSNAQIIEQVWQDAEKALTECANRGTELFLGGLTFPEVREIVPRLILDIIEGARRIRNITANLRDFSKPVEEDVRERVFINDIIEFCIAMMRNLILKHTDRFSFKPGKDIPLFWGNPQQLEQVVINLLQNALQSLPSRSCAVEAATFHDPARQLIRVIIRDEGTGMDDSLLPRITEPFFTTKLTSGGTGLGLYISYSIIKAHRGALEFKSQPGEGTEVIIELPIES